MKENDTAMGTALAAWLDLCPHVLKEMMDTGAGDILTDQLHP